MFIKIDNIQLFILYIILIELFLSTYREIYGDINLIQLRQLYKYTYLYRINNFILLILIIIIIICIIP